jgi:hypothetical protein
MAQEVNSVADGVVIPGGDGFEGQMCASWRRLEGVPGGWEWDTCRRQCVKRGTAAAQNTTGDTRPKR